jgi:uncharacterized protein YbjT (DUF2867 family)
MARVLLIGGDERARELAATLADDGHAVRVTARGPEQEEALRSAGAEPVRADPDRVGTLVPALAGTTVACWLQGTTAEPSLHGSRLWAFLEKVVDSPVRGVVYEGAGSAPPQLLAEGAGLIARAHHTWRIPVEVLDADPAEPERWRASAREAIDRLLGTQR